MKSESAFSFAIASQPFDFCLFFGRSSKKLVNNMFQQAKLSNLSCSGFSTTVTLLGRESAMLVKEGGLSLIKNDLKKTSFSQNKNLRPFLLLSMKSTQYLSKSIHYNYRLHKFVCLISDIFHKLEIFVSK